jgi:hypothetical protein
MINIIVHKPKLVFHLNAIYKHFLCYIKIRLWVTRPQVPCVTQEGSKELDLRKWLET